MSWQYYFFVHSLSASLINLFPSRLTLRLAGVNHREVGHGGGEGGSERGGEEMSR